MRRTSAAPPRSRHQSNWCGSSRRTDMATPYWPLLARAGSGVDGFAGPGGVLGWQHEAVADVADSPDQLLVLGPELGSQPAHVDIDGPSPTEVVVTPDLLQELVSGEDAPGVLGEVLEQLELLEGEVESTAADLRRVRRVVDRDLARPDHV